MASSPTSFLIFRALQPQFLINWFLISKNECIYQIMDIPNFKREQIKVKTSLTQKGQRFCLEKLNFRNIRYFSYSQRISNFKKSPTVFFRWKVFYCSLFLYRRAYKKINLRDQRYSPVNKSRNCNKQKNQIKNSLV